MTAGLFSALQSCLQRREQNSGEGVAQHSNLDVFPTCFLVISQRCFCMAASKSLNICRVSLYSASYHNKPCDLPSQSMLARFRSPVPFGHIQYLACRPSPLHCSSGPATSTNPFLCLLDELSLSSHGIKWKQPSGGRKQRCHFLFTENRFFR